MTDDPFRSDGQAEGKRQARQFLRSVDRKTFTHGQVHRHLSEVIETGRREMARKESEREMEA